MAEEAEPVPDQSKYQQVAAKLRAAIDDGTYPVGSTIPKETELVEMFGVHLKTVRTAIAELRTEGRLRPIRRRGTVVRRKPVRVALSRYQHGGPELGPWETACADSGVNGVTVLKKVDRVAVDERVAQALGVLPGTPASCRRRQHTAEGELAMVSEIWLNPQLSAGTPLELPEKIVGGIYAAWRGLGHPPASLTETVDVRLPVPEEAKLMGLQPGTSVLAIERVTRDEHGRVLDVLRAVASSEWVRLVYEDVPITAGGGGE